MSSLHKRITLVQDRIRAERIKEQARKKYLSRLRNSIIHDNENHRWIADRKGLDYVINGGGTFSYLFEYTYSKALSELSIKRPSFLDKLDAKTKWTGSTIEVPIIKG